MSDNLEVWLYGSRARGNADRASDTDLLVVGAEEGVVARAIEGMDYPRVKVSFYTWAEIKRMRAYGSLYLHHIAEEGVPLRAKGVGGGQLRRLVDDLPQFSRAREDLEGFTAAYAEGMHSLKSGGWPDFECEVVARRSPVMRQSWAPTAWEPPLSGESNHFGWPAKPLSTTVARSS